MDILRSDTQLRVTPALRETPSGDGKVDQQATHVTEFRISHLRLTVQNLIKRTNGRGRSLITPHQTYKRRGGSVKMSVLGIQLLWRTMSKPKTASGDRRATFSEPCKVYDWKFCLHWPQKST